MTSPSPTPAEKLHSDLSSIQSSLSSLQSSVRLSSLRDRLEDLEIGIRDLDNRITTLRPRGYLFEKGLEARGNQMQQNWSSVRSGVYTRLNQSCAQLEADIHPIEAQVNKLIGMQNNVALASRQVTPVKAAISGMESKVSALESSVRGMFDSVETSYQELDSHLDEIEWSLAQLEGACFQLLATEALVMAIKAVWYRDDREDKEDPDGILYLTDQRLIFEQNEEVATKKVLFITTEKKKVQQVQFETAVSLVSEIKALKKGMFKNEDNLEIHFKSGAPHEHAFLHIFGQDCNEWKALINTVACGEIQKTRTVPIAAEVLEKVKQAPSECPSCGAAITQPVLRGQDTLNCSYCGQVIRL